MATRLGSWAGGADEEDMPLAEPARPHLHRLRVGATTVHVAAFPRAHVGVSVVVLPSPEPLATWCARSGIADALVGGFFVTPGGPPLGEVWSGGRRAATQPFHPSFAPGRSCLHLHGERVTIAPLRAFGGAPAGDLLQAGPALVAGGLPLVGEGTDPEGFSAGCGQFDSDITAGRHPRAAIGVDDHRLLAVATEGRAPDEAGLTLAELAALMADLGARSAINLDGGGSTSLVVDGRLVNRPREAEGHEVPGGRPLATALAFLPRDQPAAAVA